VRRTIKSKAKFDINHINPIDFVKKCNMPSLFVIAKGDDFVRPHHSELLCKNYKGENNIIKVEGDHNSDRPGFMMDSASIFFYNILKCSELP